MIYKIKNRLYLFVFKVLIASLLAACSGDPGTDAGAGSSPASSRLAGLLGADDGDLYPKAHELRAFRFPDDHGAHPEYRNEWWYFTGNLDSRNGRRFGYELTLFRFRVTPSGAPALRSAWATEQVFVGHFAVTDVANNRFHVAERYARGAAGLAGVREQPLRIWIDDWFVENSDAADSGTWRLSAVDDDTAIDLLLEPLREPVLNGAQGLSRKSAEPGNASYYYSIPRLQTRGRLTLGGEIVEVSGQSWLDREWGSSALDAAQLGWDWFALQLSDGSDLMVYQLRRIDGTVDPFSSGTWISSSGEIRTLRRDDVELAVLDYWENEEGDRYPSGWALQVLPVNVRLTVTPVLADQELNATVRYWEGAVDVRGSVASESVTGRGYVELTGYAQE